MAYAVGFAQFGALVFALTCSGPRLSGLSPAAPPSTIRVLGWLEARYRRDACTARCAGRGLAYVLSAARRRRCRHARRHLWREFLPDLDEGSIWLPCQYAARHFAGRRRPQMAADLRSAVREFPEVAHIVSRSRPQRRRHRSVDAIAYGSGIGLSPYDTWPAGGTKHGSGRAHAGAVPPTCRASISTSASRSSTA